MLANMTQFQVGANSKIKGTGRPKSQPNTKTFFPTHRSEMLLAKRLSMALTAPKPPMNDRINAFDSIPNSSLPINGTIVYSRPIIAPTNAFTKSRTKNCLMFGPRPSLIESNSPSPEGFIFTL